MKRVRVYAEPSKEAEKAEADETMARPRRRLAAADCDDKYWRYAYAPNGKIYYYNSQTKQSQWKRPWWGDAECFILGSAPIPPP